MARTHFQDFKRDDGSPITIEYSFSPGSETTYSPTFGACGGDPCEVEIVSVMPATPEYEALCSKSLRMDDTDPEFPDVERQIKAARDAIELTADECERFYDYIAEHHVLYEDDYEPEDLY